MSAVPAAVEQATALGAHQVERREPESGTWVVMADPDGNLFYLVAA